MSELSDKRRNEISSYMTSHLWVAEYLPKQDRWIMSKEPYPYSDGPFEVMALGATLEDAFDKAKIQQEKALSKQVDAMAEVSVDESIERKHEIIDKELDEEYEGTD